MPNGSVVVVGGGATCFSMGTFWNKGVYTIHGLDAAGNERPGPPRTSGWEHAKTIFTPSSLPDVPKPVRPQTGDGIASIAPIPRLRLETADDFVKIVRHGRPVVLEGLNLGSCVSAWTLDYLIDKVGADRKVRIQSRAFWVHRQTPADRDLGGDP
jgi:tRNA wybutosine-synthesizing protein 4